MFLVSLVWFTFCGVKSFCLTFFFLAVSTHVGVVAVERPRRSMRTAAVILSIQGVDGDVDQMEDYFAAIHVSVRILQYAESIINPSVIPFFNPLYVTKGT